MAEIRRGSAHSGFRTCPSCKKRFYVGSLEMWVYRTTKYNRPSYDYFCSWSCFREGKRKKTEERARRKQKGLEKLADTLQKKRLEAQGE